MSFYSTLSTETLISILVAVDADINSQFAATEIVKSNLELMMREQTALMNRAMHNVHMSKTVLPQKKAS